tara:strand:+ start:34261 stop:34455 length:195 start_codon:yes stop_codon:yes gene_type:complete
MNPNKRIVNGRGIDFRDISVFGAWTQREEEDIASFYLTMKGGYDVVVYGTKEEHRQLLKKWNEV